MQRMKNATKPLNTPAWHHRHTEKLMVAVAARQPSKISGGTYTRIVSCAAGTAL